MQWVYKTENRVDVCMYVKKELWRTPKICKLGEDTTVSLQSLFHFDI